MVRTPQSEKKHECFREPQSSKTKAECLRKKRSAQRHQLAGRAVLFVARLLLGSGLGACLVGGMCCLAAHVHFSSTPCVGSLATASAWLAGGTCLAGARSHGLQAWLAASLRCSPPCLVCGQLGWSAPLLGMGVLAAAWLLLAFVVGGLSLSAWLRLLGRRHLNAWLVVFRVCRSAWPAWGFLANFFY